MGENYNYWTLDERCRLRGLLEMGMGVSAIARRLGRHRSTVYREIERNRCVGGYRPDSADNRAAHAWLARLARRALHPPARVRGGPPCHGMVP